MSSKDNDEECVMHSKLDNIEIMINDKADEMIGLSQSFLYRYQIGFEIFDCVHSLHYKFHKINFKRGGSYIDSPDRIKDKLQLNGLAQVLIASLDMPGQA